VTEEEIRELLTDYVEKQGCWGGRPANKWSISKIEDCNVYIGTLETFIEERDMETRVKSYNGGSVDDKTSGHAPGPWEIDMRHEFPLLFTPRKLARQKMPSSESVQPCGGTGLFNLYIFTSGNFCVKIICECCFILQQKKRKS